MTRRPGIPEPSVDETLETLRALGLTEYQAKCFLGLARVSSATASELSAVSGVPRSRIYDVADGLVERGLIEVEPGETKRYRAVPVEMAVNKFQREYQSLIADLETQLQNLDPPESEDDSVGVWTVAGRENVLDRARAMIDMADEELFLMVEREDLLVEACIRRIKAASNRGARIVVVSESPGVHESIESRVPDCTLIDATGDAIGVPVQGGVLGRIVMADREAVMVATLGSSDSAAEPDVMGIWGSGRENGFVAVLSQLLGNWLDDAKNVPVGD